ncbi:hypothetical protein [Nocardioides sp. PD653]|uniref:hypothetical protein n=1 Tax=Nocardioides sp. PD653 TaxID=393303 RepID=UPI0009F0D2B5|nr:hypothetical protein [Nocardioides sp. PD653]GAW54752.1 hypothetical protein PD653_2166 [Nocardioides sp. PD653]
MSDVTVVEGRCRRRRLDLDDFADITDVPALDIGPCGAGTAVTFDGELTAEQVARVQHRMDSLDDVDEAARDDIRTKRAAVAAEPSVENVAALAVATANYQLGEV